MKRTLTTIMTICVLIFSFAISSLLSFADNRFILDNSNVLTDVQEDNLEEKASQIYDKYGITAVILTRDDIEEDRVEEYADDYFYTNYGKKTDGILLFISFCDRDVVIVSYGQTGYVFSKKVNDRIISAITSDLSDGEYYDAFCIFFEKVVKRQDEYGKTGDDDYDDSFYFDPETGETIRDNKEFPLFAVGAIIVVSLIIAFCVVGKMKRNLKTARRSDNAGDYVKKGSFLLKLSKDLYLYGNTTRVAKPRDNSSSSSHGSSGHFGSSGGGHSVSHGKF